jgi:hypothetical protein
MTKTTKVARFKENPFIDEMIIPMGTKSVKLQSLGKNDNIIVNQGTGESMGTAITTYKKVDADQFVKLFVGNIALTFDLNSAGIKAFNVLMWMVQYKAIAKDLVYLGEPEMDDFLKENPNIKEFKRATFSRGLKQLVDAKIIAHAQRQGMYFINPSFCFNGSRLAFTNIIEKRTDKVIKKITAGSKPPPKPERCEKTGDFFGVDEKDFK